MGADWAGEWFGHYVNPDAPRDDGPPEYALQVELSQWGEVVSGTMIDLDPANAVPLARWPTLPSAERWSAVERLSVSRLLSRYPHAIVESTLPTHSDIVGRATGDEIEFEKSYRGETLIVWRDGDREIGRQTTGGHAVRYRGRQSEDGRRVTGRWTIRAPGIRGWLGKDLGQGEFVLSRRE